MSCDEREEETEDDLRRKSRYIKNIILKNLCSGRSKIAVGVDTNVTNTKIAGINVK